MGALPKSRISPRRRRNKRAHWKLSRLKLVRCHACDAWARPHHVCAACGSYRGVQVVDLDKDL